MRFVFLNFVVNYYVGKFIIYEVFIFEFCCELFEVIIYMYEVFIFEFCSELFKVVWYVEVKVVFSYV